MPNWYTIFHTSFSTPALAREALITLREFAKVVNIPPATTWRVYPRGVGLVVTAEWRYSDPEAVPATEVDNIGGVPIILKEAPNEN